MTDFKEVVPEDFLTFSREQPSYVTIEKALIELGGGSNKGIEFKRETLQKAGWHHGKLVSYGAHAEQAAEVFNRVREILSSTSTSEEVLAKLG